MSAGRPLQLATRRLSLLSGHPPSFRNFPKTHYLPSGHWDGPPSRTSMRSGAPIRSSCSAPPRQPICPGSCPFPPRTPRAAAPRRFLSTGQSRTCGPTPPFPFYHKSSPESRPAHVTSPSSPRASNTSPGGRSPHATAPRGCNSAPPIPSSRWPAAQPPSRRLCGA